MVQYLLDEGGRAVLDSQTFTWFARHSWHHKVFTPDAPRPHQQVVILAGEQDDGDGRDDRLWVRTRGMRKYGRPDLSIHRVPTDKRDEVIDFCNQHIELFAQGAVVGDGQTLVASALPPGSVHLAGALDDPDFNNVHLEVRFDWPNDNPA
jgi:hypothetical protein